MDQHRADPQAVVRKLCQEGANDEQSDNVTVVYVEVT